MARAARLKRVPGIVGIWLAIAGCQAVDANEPVRVDANDNRTPAGRLERDVLTVQLEAREGRWHPNGDQAEGLVMQVFAESGRAPQNPGPMLRVVTGTTIRASVHNALPDSLIVYGLHTRPGTIEDTLHLTPGETREVSFAVGAPGTYFYWGSTTHEDIFDRNGKDSQLLGAFIVDSTGPTRPDRVFVLGSWTGPVDTTLGFGPELRVINGLSWPHTERLTYTAGDTVIWRWVNPTDSPHPMHLHGFYFDILSRGNWAADTVFAPDARPLVVTEMPVPGQTFTMRWAPTEPGNWLFHCHVAFHTSLFLGTKIPPDPADPLAVHHTQGMQGMIMALTVHPGASAARRPDNGPNARNIRLIAQAARRRFKGTLDELAFVRQEGNVPPAPDSVPTQSSVLVLRRNEPVRITIVNRTRTTTGVHWHGIEVPSYSDGVPDFSGQTGRLAPVIAPNDSFVASFTPTRSGTFIYHAHANEAYQINLGLYGGLLVVDSTGYDPERDKLIIFGSAGPQGERGARINGSLTPDTLRLKVGVAYRLRLVHIIPDFTAWIALLQGEKPVRWKPLAKDGAELPVARQVIRPSFLLAGPGETMDFEFTPTAPGMLRLEVEQRTGAFKNNLPIKVDR